MYEFESRNAALNTWMLLRQAWEATLRATEKDLKKKGATLAEADVLFVVDNYEGPTTPAEIARWVFRRTQSVAGLLNRMEKRDLVERRKDQEDRRLTRIVMTQKGKQLYASADSTGTIQKIMSCLSPQDTEHLERCLKQLRQCALQHLGMEPPKRRHREESSRLR